MSNVAGLTTWFFYFFFFWIYFFLLREVTICGSVMLKYMLHGGILWHYFYFSLKTHKTLGFDLIIKFKPPLRSWNYKISTKVFDRSLKIDLTRSLQKPRILFCLFGKVSTCEKKRNDRLCFCTVCSYAHNGWSGWKIQEIIQRISYDSQVHCIIFCCLIKKKLFHIFLPIGQHWS